MKTNIRTAILTSTFVLGLTLGFAQLLGKKDQQIEEVNKVGEYKAKSREKIKPYRYDGSKVTYFNYTAYEQRKSVEVLLFNGSDYKFCFNTDGVPKSVALKIYDKEQIAKDRILLFESANVMGKDVVVTSEELLKTLQAKKNTASLKRIFIEYIVPVTDKKAEAPQPQEGKKKNDEAPADPQERGIVVVSYGYRNI